MAKRKLGALKTAKFPPPSPFRKNEDFDKANVAFGDLEFEAAIQEYVKDSPVALLALQDINKRGGISKFIKAINKGEKSYGTTRRAFFRPSTGEIKYNATDILSYLDRLKGKQPHPIYGENRPTMQQVKDVETGQGSMESIAHELFHYGMQVLRKEGYEVPKLFDRSMLSVEDFKKKSTDEKNEEAIIDFLEKTQRKRMGVGEDDFTEAGKRIYTGYEDDLSDLYKGGLYLKRSDRPKELIGVYDDELDMETGYTEETSPFSKFSKKLFGGSAAYAGQMDAGEALDRFEGMALSELDKRNYARTKEPLKDTREKSFIEKLAGLNPFREKERPMYREGGVVNMLKKMK